MKKYLLDTTLRDGEQAPGVIFSTQQKIEIAHYLDRLGIDEVEVGTPAMGQAEQNDIRAIVKAGFGFETSAWCRALKSDIDAAAICETDAVSISFPVSSIQLNSLGKSYAWVEEEMPRLVSYAQKKFKRVYIGFQDATRCDVDTLHRIAALAVSLGVDRIRIADTVGIMNPLTTRTLFKSLRAKFRKMDFEFHAHNDLGMATANAFVALESGATGVSATVNGLGERAGNTALEELIMACRLDSKISSYNTSLLKDLSQYVERISRQSLSVSKPIVGENVFTHETGIHVNSLLKNKLSYQAFDESLVGHKSNRIVIGKHSGRHSYINYYASRGLNLHGEHLDQVYNTIKEIISRQGQSPDESQMLEVYYDIVFSKEIPTR